jgi:hypothetical protein
MTLEQGRLKKGATERPKKISILRAENWQRTGRQRKLLTKAAAQDWFRGNFGNPLVVRKGGGRRGANRGAVSPPHGCALQG